MQKKIESKQENLNSEQPNQDLLTRIQSTRLFKEFGGKWMDTPKDSGCFVTTSIRARLEAINSTKQKINNGSETGEANIKAVESRAADRDTTPRIFEKIRSRLGSHPKGEQLLHRHLIPGETKSKGFRREGE